MVDIVVNVSVYQILLLGSKAHIGKHFAWPGPANTTDYSIFYPFNSSEYFHSYCTISDSDYVGNQTAVEVVSTVPKLLLLPYQEQWPAVQITLTTHQKSARGVRLEFIC